MIYNILVLERTYMDDDTSWSHPRSISCNEYIRVFIFNNIWHRHWIGLPMNAIIEDILT